MADSTVTLVGNLTRDPELRSTQSGQAIATLGIAVSRRYQQHNAGNSRRLIPVQGAGGIRGR